MKSILTTTLCHQPRPLGSYGVQRKTPSPFDGRVAEIDPLGLASPFIVSAKILSQELWTMGLGWDEPITQEISTRTKEWFLELDDLKGIKVPRILRDRTEETASSVHTFVDTSNDAYGAVKEQRMKIEGGSNTRTKAKILLGSLILSIGQVEQD